MHPKKQPPLAANEETVAQEGSGPKPPEDSPRRVRRVGDYELVEELACGGMDHLDSEIVAHFHEERPGLTPRT
jgi:hypothetical protein